VWSVFGWVLIGFAIWALMLIMHVVQKRYAPEWNDTPNKSGRHKLYRRSRARGFWDSMWDAGDDDDSEPSAEQAAALVEEIRALKERVKVLEAIVTDRSWQYDEELKRSQ